MDIATAAADRKPQPLEADGNPQIVVLDRGFVYVGIVSINGDVMTIMNALCVRRWGTSKGLGEIASKGPQENTKLDLGGTIRAPISAVIHLIDCDPISWADYITITAEA